MRAANGRNPDIVQLLDSKVLPYLIFLVVPVLGRMSDADDALRFIATNTFASLVKMVPLEVRLTSRQWKHLCILCLGWSSRPPRFF